MRMSVLKIALAGTGLMIGLGSLLAAQDLKTKPSQSEEVKRQIRILAPAMAQKLKHSQDLIAALAVEDFDRIADNARSLRKLDLETLWKVSPNLNYVKYSAELAVIADELARCAKDRDLNGATLAYVRMTINCVDCHKFVRDNRILDISR